MKRSLPRKCLDGMKRKDGRSFLLQRDQFVAREQSGRMRGDEPGKVQWRRTGNTASYCRDRLIVSRYQKKVRGGMKIGKVLRIVPASDECRESSRRGLRAAHDRNNPETLLSHEDGERGPNPPCPDNADVEQPLFASHSIHPRPSRRAVCVVGGRQVRQCNRKIADHCLLLARNIARCAMMENVGTIRA